MFEALTEAEASRILNQGSQEGWQLISRDYRYLDMNEAAVRHGQARREALLGRQMEEAYPGIERTAMFAELRRCMEERDRGELVNKFEDAMGRSQWFRLRFEPVAAGLVVLSLELTDHHRSEEALDRCTRVVGMARACRHVMAQATQEQALLRSVCRLVVRRGGYKLAWIGLKAPGPGYQVEPLASAGVDEGYTANLGITWDESPSGQGPTGRAIREGKTTVARFIDVDEGYGPWRAYC